ncbi:hypothetical protein LGN30_21710 [Burkholderia seminalis]|uniref:hypothetical protein n=1 Tax=Burkholderia seminalis TaxID=488731 RepID=UPI001CF0F991|nr:hypothetical protein [Burkholderia seminalis]MCA8425808.1 hypothetical protein [Burkholderia seminalis]
MLIKVGKHAGKDARKVLFDDPSYVRWVPDQSNPTGGLLVAQKEFKRLIADIDKKPFVGQCAGRCKRPVTRTTAYQNSPTLYSWCDSCNPHSLGAESGKLYVVKSYADAENHVAMTCEGHKATLKEIVRELAKAKGMASRFTAAAMSDFLP